MSGLWFFFAHSSAEGPIMLHAGASLNMFPDSQLSSFSRGNYYVCLFKLYEADLLKLVLQTSEEIFRRPSQTLPPSRKH